MFALCLLGAASLLAGSHLPHIGPVLSGYLVSSATLYLFAGSAFFMACVVVTAIQDINVAFGYELAPSEREKINRFVSKAQRNPLYRFAITSTSNYQLYDLNDHDREDPQLPFTHAELARQLKAGAGHHENLSEEMKAAVLEAMMEEYRQNHPEEAD